MNASFHAQIEFSSSFLPPDPWTEGCRLPLDHVISRKQNGAVASRVGDFQWDWSSYRSRGRNGVYNFIYWARGNASKTEKHIKNINKNRLTRIREMQHLMTLIIYKRNGLPLSSSTLDSYMSSLVRIALFAESKNISISDVLAQSKYIDQLIQNVHGTAASMLFRWWNVLRELDTKDVGFKQAQPLKIIDLRKKAEAARKNKKQKAALPTRIYSEFINALLDEMDEIGNVVDELAQIIRDVIKDRSSRPKVLRYKSDRGKATALMRTLIHSATAPLREYLHKRNYADTLNSLNSAISDIQRLCKLAIHTFTGMRSAEASYLPYHCLQVEKGRNGVEHIFIIGITTKLAQGNRRRTRWVTNSVGHRAVEISSKLASVIYDSIGILPKSSDSKKDDYPLFISSSHLPWAGSTKNTFRPATAMSLNDACIYLQQRLQPIIEESDIEELEQIDPYRNWRDEPMFTVGQSWKLESHQLRRSLALYAQRSGLVGLSSLRRQLQHITKEMTQYYARGSQFAHNYIESDEYNTHFCKEWRETKSESECLSYLRDIILTDETLFGGAGKFIQKIKNRGEVLHREELMKRFNKGMMSYRSNVLGGCTNPNECESSGKGLSLLNTNCLEKNCEHLIAKRSKIESVIPYQKKFVESLEPGSVEYSMEQRELDILIMSCED